MLPQAKRARHSPKGDDGQISHTKEACQVKARPGVARRCE